jgi:hypothetical protein
VRVEACPRVSGVAGASRIDTACTLHSSETRANAHTTPPGLLNAMLHESGGRRASPALKTASHYSPITPLHLRPCCTVAYTGMGDKMASGACIRPSTAGVSVLLSKQINNAKRESWVSGSEARQGS